MGEVVNLRLQRKRAARRAVEAVAADNRTAHGLPKAVRQLAERRSNLEAARLDGHLLSADETHFPSDEAPTVPQTPDDAS